MNRAEIYQVVIEGQREDYEKDPEFSSIEPFVKEFPWVNDINSTFMEIHQEPTYEMIRNQFSFERRRDMTGENKLNYDNFLSSEQIQSLSFWEYEGEKIYGLAIYGRWDDMWDSATSKDVATVTKALIDYLKQNHLISYHKETMDELQKLNKVADFASKFDYEIKFFNPNV